MLLLGAIGAAQLRDSDQVNSANPVLGNVFFFQTALFVVQPGVAAVRSCYAQKRARKQLDANAPAHAPSPTQQPSLLAIPAPDGGTVDIPLLAMRTVAGASTPAGNCRAVSGAPGDAPSSRASRE